MPAGDLLRTKLSIPPLRSKLVPRIRLINRLREGFQLKLTLVSAPAGFGKTTLVSEALKTSGLPSGWVSLDEHDKDPARFWSYFITALQSILPDAGTSVLGYIRSSQPPPIESLLTALINEISDIDHDFVLVLDDYHTIESSTIHSAIAFLLDQLPAQMHLVIISRTDPPLPLARLRGRALMAEIRAGDLRFNRDETAIFMNEVMELGITDTDIAALESRAEGWITGLHMAALSLQGRKDTSDFIIAFTGSHRFILDYLIDEVLQKQPVDIQDFLLKTSILDRLTPPLCDVVTERTDSRDVLRLLEHNNLFVIPLDQARQWYRYEHLFADLLRHQMVITTDINRIDTLHNRASLWYEANDSIPDAIHHAIKAGNWERALVLIRNVSDMLMKHGETTTLVNWVKVLPEEMLFSHPDLFSNYMWALILTGNIDTAGSYLEQAEKTLQDDPLSLGGIIAMQAYIARIRGDNQHTILLSTRALSLLPKEDFALRSIISLNLGMTLWQSGSSLSQASTAFYEADYTGRQTGNEYVAVTAKSFLGAIEASQGNLHKAEVLLREAVHTSQSPAGALGCIYLGTLLYEWNILKEANQQILRGIDLSQQSGNHEIQIGGYRLLAYIRQALNDFKGALDALQKADSITQSTGASTFEQARNMSCHVIIDLAQGNLPSAENWAARMSEDADVLPFYPRLNVTKARVFIAQNRKTDAQAQLNACYQQAVEQNLRFAQVEICVLQSLASTDITTALTFLADALQMGEAEGYVRTFLDKGEALADLLRKAKSHGISTTYTSKLLAAFQIEFEALRHTSNTVLYLSQPLAEPLSEREMAVLQLLSEGLSNREIAEKLVISTGTAKTHVHSIISKLNATGRTQAVTRARELKLI